MTTTYTPARTWHAGITLPADGELTSATSVNAPLEQVADNIAYLNAPATTGANYPLYASGHTCSRMAGPPILAAATIANGTISVSTYGTVTFLDANAQTAAWIVDVPHGASITSYRVYVDPAHGHSGLPANMPIVSLFAIDEQGVAATTDTKTDASLLAAYNTKHAIYKALSSPWAVDRDTYRYVITVTNETGTSALPNLNVFTPSIQFNPTIVDPGAG
jgi:hypothetical protein